VPPGVAIAFRGIPEFILRTLPSLVTIAHGSGGISLKLIGFCRYSVNGRWVLVQKYAYSSSRGVPSWKWIESSIAHSMTCSSTPTGSYFFIGSLLSVSRENDSGLLLSCHVDFFPYISRSLASTTCDVLSATAAIKIKYAYSSLE